jgi:hypothetical protein
MGSKQVIGFGSLIFSYIKARFGNSTSLRTLCANLGLAAPDVFPDDFYSKVFLSLAEAGTRSASAQTFSLAVVSFGGWTVTKNQLWITLNTTSGSGSGSVSVSLFSNSGSQRSGTITITQTNSGESTTSTVTQRGATGGSILVSPTFKTVFGNGESFVVTVTANIAWAVTDNAAWISASPISGSGNGSFTVTVAAYPAGPDRTGIVTVSGSGASSTITIDQSSNIP